MAVGGTPAAGHLIVENWRELNKAFRDADKDTQRLWRDRQKEMAEPVRQTAEQLAQGGIRNIGQSWSQMRTGVTSKVVYVAPKRRRRGGQPRPNLAPLLAGQAMEPALEQHAGEIEARFGRLLDQVEREFNHGGRF